LIIVNEFGKTRQNEKAEQKKEQEIFGFLLSN